MKILGVTISSKLSVSEHVQQAVSRYAQSLHVLTSRGIYDNHHTAGLQVGRTRRDDVCYQCMVGLHYCVCRRLSAELFALVSTQQIDGSNLQQPVTPTQTTNRLSVE